MLIKNVLFAGSDEQRYRVLSIDAGAKRGWVFPLDEKNGWPIYRDFWVLTGHANVREIKTSGKAKVPDLAFFSASARNRAKQAHEYIKPLLEHPDIYNGECRGKLVKARAAELNVSPTTLYRYLSLWWRNGQTQLALIPEFNKIGRTALSKTAHRGRRPVDDKYDVFQMSEKDVENVKKAIRQHYLNGEISTLAGAHRKMRREDYSFLDGNGKPFLLPDGEFPSIHQFRHIARTNFSLTEMLRKKHGAKRFDKKFGPHIGSALEECIGIGHIFEIDATIADVYLVAAADHASIIGKPTLYLIYDRWSRLITGFYVGLENASWTGAMLAILSIATDKRELCERYGVAYNPDDWPADGAFPQKFLGDLGEMASKDSYRICDGMEATVSNTQSLHPQRKGTIECGFRLFHASIQEILPGYEPPYNAVKRREKRYDRDASLTLDEFITVVIKSIIAHNHGIMKGYDLNPMQVLTDTQAIPIRLWNDDMIRRSGALARYDYDYLHLQLLPQDDAVVTDDGILYRRCYYDAPVEWLTRAAARRKRFKVKCSYDLRLANSILVYDPNHPEVPIECQLTGASKNYKGYSFAEVEYIERKAGLVKFDGKYESDNAKAEFEGDVSELSKAAVARRRVTAKGMSRSGRRADTKAVRDAERAAIREREAGMPASLPNTPSNVIPMPDRTSSVESPPPTNADVAVKRRTSIQDQLKRIAQEKINGH
ncbi:transposon Tn7 transposition protein TnsB [Paraburkholderia hospita]|uniref:Transposon Tn7 transposition protein TnsB n=1 Tax=Paraburkholderia hospita TaxID=169430 RepID=A0ABN0FRY9_9BURK|nr:hypothetical protein [Paraburkholderia hospita]EIN01542.1 transposon Tn7 transposition protein TnsB [Paraburkholderia hospita]OUL70261.1 transcriptional antiterminator [Paraburkholderia hospita]